LRGRQTFKVKQTNITIISGLSGSGKSTAIAAFEDAGYYCVDNMPVALLPKFLALPFDRSTEFAGFAFGMDLREKDFIAAYPSVFEKIKKNRYNFEIIFLEAQENVLLRRYSQTRRHHPLAFQKNILAGIEEEKFQLQRLRKIADKIIDTTQLNIHELKLIIFNHIHEDLSDGAMRINIMSFGFKFGIPPGVDLIVDVRFLQNPYFVPELKDFDGEASEVRDFVLSGPETQIFLKKYLDLLDYLIPLYEKEGKAYLSIALGCTGGRHRSVVIAREIYNHFESQDKRVEIIHRDKGE